MGHQDKSSNLKQSPSNHQEEKEEEPEFW